MSKCKYVICGSSGNCSLWIALYRGNADNIFQCMGGNKYQGATSLTWSVKAIFGSAASASLGTAAGLTNTLTLTPPADAGTHCLLVTCVDSQNISQTIFYTVVYA